MAIEAQPQAVVEQLLARIRRLTPISEKIEWCDGVERRIQLEHDEGLYDNERAEQWIERIRSKMDEWDIPLVDDDPPPEPGHIWKPKYYKPGSPGNPDGVETVSKPRLTAVKDDEPSGETKTASAYIKNPNAPASAAQDSLVTKLLNDLERLDHPEVMSYVTRVRDLRDAGQWTKGKASEAITAMIAAVKELKERRKATAPATRPKLPDIPTGRYALEWEGKLRFFQVTQNRRKTFYNAYELFGSPGAFRRVPLRYEQMLALFEELAKDPVKPMRHFGYMHTICGRCGAELSDTPSIIAGFGPDCAKYLGVSWG